MPIYKEQCVTLRFVTPAFLGGAEEASELRTPPFKSLLRRWWRIVAVGGGRPDIDTLRENEGRLFGHAWLKDNGKAWASKSCVRLAIDGWAEGNMTAWPTDPKVKHPEVQHGRDVGSHLYLGYGPLTYVKERGATGFHPDARTSAIKEQFEFTLAVRGASDRWAELHLDDVLTLWAWFGTIGSRSRNGWGSVEIVNHPALGGIEALKRFSRPFADCFDSDWPHAIGRDEQGLLVWRTRQDFATWLETMRALAEIKIAFRTALAFSWSPTAAACGKRHVVAYPVTNHPVRPWDGSGDDAFRLANQLCFRVQRTAHGGNPRYRAVAFHLPHRLPKPMLAKLDPGTTKAVQDGEQAVWREVHRTLDGCTERCK